MKKSILIILVSLAVSVFSGEREKYQKLLALGDKAITVLDQGFDPGDEVTLGEVAVAPQEVSQPEVPEAGLLAMGEEALAYLDSRGGEFKPQPYTVASVDSAGTVGRVVVNPEGSSDVAYSSY